MKGGLLLVGKGESIADAIAKLRALHEQIGAMRPRVGDPGIRELIKDENFMSVWRTMLDLYGAVDDFLRAADRRGP